jgi:hypothetical protein
MKRMWKKGRGREGVRKRRECGGRVDGGRVGDKNKRVLKEGRRRVVGIREV